MENLQNSITAWCYQRITAMCIVLCDHSIMVLYCRIVRLWYDDTMVLRGITYHSNLDTVIVGK